MSEVKVNKISPRSGTNVQLGDSGDTITVPSGATLDASNATTTLPANVVTTTGSQTLTNKIIGSSQLTGALPALDGSALTGIPDTIAPTRHSIRPSLNLDFANSKVLDPRITFTRASNATYYDGYTSVKAEENLIYPSIPSSSGWSESNLSFTTNNATAPDGTTTATLVTASSGTGIIPFTEVADSESTQTVVFTHSIFAKAGTHNYVQLTVNSQASFYANFDLSTGSVGTTGGGVTTSITDVGNSWYRISMTFTSDGHPNAPHVRVSLQNSSSDTRFQTWNPAGTETVYLWGGQSEIRDSLTAYTPTTTQPITNYVPALQTAGNNVARFDHNPTTGESLGLLIEESRTNLIPYSEEFDNAVWTKGNATITANTIIAPDGTLTGDKLVEDTATSTHGVQKTGIAVTVGVTYTMSAFIKKGERTTASISCSTSRLQMNTTFDLEAGTVVSSSASSSTITNVGNGWYRVTATNTLTSAGAVAPFILLQDFSPYTGDGYSGIYIWGIQLEAGAFPTSYIKTTASQVTRSGDDAKMQNINTSDWYKFSGYSFYAEGNFNGGFNINVGARGILGATQNGSVSNRFILGYNGTDVVVSQSRYAGTSTTVSTAINGSTIDDNFIKVAISLDFNNFISSANGTTGSSTTNLPSLPNLTELTFGRWTATNQINGCIKKVSYYPINLTQNEINDLTEE
jgi:hypothetical protein